MDPKEHYAELKKKLKKKSSFKSSYWMWAGLGWRCDLGVRHLSSTKAAPGRADH